jgi:hypothetical protein
MARSAGAFVLVALSPDWSYYWSYFRRNDSNFLQSIFEIFLKDRSEELPWID